MTNSPIDLQKIKIVLVAEQVEAAVRQELLKCFEDASVASSDGALLKCFQNLKLHVSDEENRAWIDEETKAIRRRIDSPDPLIHDPSKEIDSHANTVVSHAAVPGSKATRKSTAEPKRNEDIQNLYPHAKPLARLLIQTLLDDQNLCEFLGCYLLPNEKSVPLDRLVEHLIDTTPWERVGYEYPLARLGSVLEWGDSLGNDTWKESRETLKEVSDILWMLSCPSEDFQRLESSMRTILDKQVLADVPEVATKVQQDVEDWMGAVRLQLLEKQFKEWESQHRFQGYTAGQLRTAFLEKRIRFISCPGLPPKGRAPAAWFAEECLKDLNVSPEEDQGGLAAQFREVLRLAVEGQFQQIVAMFIAQDRRVAIDTLSKEFPKLLLIKLPELNATHYTRISRDWDRVRNLIESP